MMKVTINRKDGMGKSIFNDAEAYATVELCNDFFWVRRNSGKTIQYIAIDTISDIIIDEE